MIAGPTWMYHRSKEPQLVTTAEEFAALGEGWADSPAKFAQDAPTQEMALDERATVPVRRRGRSAEKESV